MRLHQFCLVLVVVVSTVVSVSLPTQANCIDGCKCKEQILPPRRTFEVLSCDSSFVLTTNTLKNVPKNVTSIRLKHVDIRKITQDAFKGFIDLQELNIVDSSIGPIETAAFDLELLHTLTFSKVHFDESPNLKSENLEELIFEDCQLSEVPNLDQVPILSFLNLANNRITNIPESAFSKIINVEEINLTNNSISIIPFNLFKGTELDTLKLDYNPLKSFNIYSDSLESLSLAHCNLTVFDKNISKNLTSLSFLDLSGNQIEVLPIDTFEPLKQLETLDLSDNKLVALDDDIFVENSRLDKIVLSNNQLTKLPNFQTKAKTFQTYHFLCKNCGLKSASGLENMKGLTTIDLSNNEIRNIEDAFTEIQGLKQLFLSNNKITKIGIKSFGTKSQLETLDLSNNPLLPLGPVAFALALPHLKILNVSSCGLEKLWYNYNAVLPELTQLYAGHNKLSTIEVKDIKVMPKLKVIDLQENSLSCNDKLHEVVQYFTKKSIYPAETGSTKTHEEIHFAADSPDFGYGQIWPKVLPPNCDFSQDIKANTDTFGDDEDEDSGNYNDEDDDLYEVDDEDDEDDDDDEYDEADENEEIPVEKSMADPSSFNLAKATYILSITSVFILTAVLVTVVAVVCTLLVLKRNKSFNIRASNLPRLKIPLWYTQPGQKKHSGSVYRPLSEDLYGSRTPIINRYEFKQTPQVHNSIP